MVMILNYLDAQSENMVGIDKLENALIEKYHESEIDQFKISFREPDNQYSSFLHTRTDRSGEVTRDGF